MFLLLPILVDYCLCVTAFVFFAAFVFFFAAAATTAAAVIIVVITAVTIAISKQLVREVAGSRGAAGGKKGGDID